MLAAEDAPLFTQLVADNFDQSSRTFVAALRECLPELSPDEVLWRFHFMLGTIYYSASSPQRIKAFSRGRCDPGDVEATVRHLVPFLAAAFRSPPVTPTRGPGETDPRRRRKGLNRHLRRWHRDGRVAVNEERPMASRPRTTAAARTGRRPYEVNLDFLGDRGACARIAA